MNCSDLTYVLGIDVNDLLAGLSTLYFTLSKSRYYLYVTLLYYYLECAFIVLSCKILSINSIASSGVFPGNCM